MKRRRTLWASRICFAIALATVSVAIASLWFLADLGPRVAIGGGTVLVLVPETNRPASFKVERFDSDVPMRRRIEGLFEMPFVLRGYAGKIEILSIPFWTIALPFAAAGIVLRFLAGRPVPGPGYCRRCGYNLKGNTSRICPECGTATEHEFPAEHYT